MISRPDPWIRQRRWPIPWNAAIGNAVIILKLWGLETRSWGEEGLKVVAAAKQQRAGFLHMYQTMSLQLPHTLE